jgi:hypothetical protein
VSALADWKADQGRIWGAASWQEIADGTASFRATHLLWRNAESPSAVSLDLAVLLARRGQLK